MDWALDPADNCPTIGMSWLTWPTQDGLGPFDPADISPTFGHVMAYVADTSQTYL
jgi:hypothetical protein